jgi:hypothetical protein
MFAFASIGTLKSLSAHQSKLETQRVMKEKDMKIRGAQRLLLTGLEAVHWKVVLDYTVQRDIENVMCDVGVPLEEFLTVGIRAVGHRFIREYAEHHVMNLEDIAWDIEAPADESRRLFMKQEEQEPEPVARKLVPLGGPQLITAVKHFDGRCTICNPVNDLSHPDDILYDPELHPKYLSGILSRFLLDHIQKHCIPDLQHLVFEMWEEEGTR